jgi:hypothetical protein
VHPARRGLVRKLGHRRHDTAPGRGPIDIAGERQFVSASSGLLKSVVAIALDHELRSPPNVDLGYQYAKFMKSPPGPPMTLGNAAAARVPLIVWCKACRHQIEPEPAELASRHGADVPVRDWCERLACSRCGSRQADMVVTGTKRR